MLGSKCSINVIPNVFNFYWNNCKLNKWSSSTVKVKALHWASKIWWRREIYLAIMVRPEVSLHSCRHTYTLMRCVLILYGTLGPTFYRHTQNERFFEKLFMAILFTLIVFAKNLLKGNRRGNTMHFVLMSGLVLEPWLYV